MSAPPRSRRWFRYSLRTGFVLLTLFCVWLGVQVKWIRDRQEARAWIIENDGFFAKDLAAPWSIRLFDNGTPYIDLPFGQELTLAQIIKLRQLFPEAQIVTFDSKKDKVELSTDGLTWLDLPKPLPKPKMPSSQPANTDNDAANAGNPFDE